MAYKRFKSYKKFKKPFKRYYKKANTTEQGRTQILTITRSVPLNGMYSRPIFFPLLLPALLACGRG